MPKTQHSPLAGLSADIWAELEGDSESIAGAVFGDGMPDSTRLSEREFVETMARHWDDAQFRLGILDRYGPVIQAPGLKPNFTNPDGTKVFRHPKGVKRFVEIGRRVNEARGMGARGIENPAELMRNSRGIVAVPSSAAPPTPDLSTIPPAPEVPYG